MQHFTRNTTSVTTSTARTHCPYPNLHRWRDLTRIAANMAPVRCRGEQCEWSRELQRHHIQDCKNESDTQTIPE